MRQALTNSFWTANPISRPAVGFVCGLTISLVYSLNNYDLFFASSIAAASLSILFNSFRSTLKPIYSSLAGIVLFVAFVSLGLSSYSFAKVKVSNYKLPLSQLNQSYFAKVKISGDIKNKSTHQASFNATLLQIKINDTWQSANSKLKCNINDATGLSFAKGEVIFIKGYYYLPPFSYPDSSFDYRSWLLNSHYSAVVKILPQHILKIKEAGNFEKWILKFRKTLGSYFSESSYSEVSINLAKALLLGQKSGLDANTKENFSNSGIIHILAVSGLHVGLIYGGLSYLLNLISFLRKLKVVKALILISILWVYAALTGFSPSVCRASFMLTIATIALNLNLYTLPFNALFSTALVMLIINPFEINNLSFLLSFSAVYGILSVSPIINKLSRKPGFFIKWISISIVISTSAQLATLPFTLYVFGQFPTYFMLANLVAIPLATIITCSGFLALALQFIPYLGDSFLFISMFSIEILEIWSSFISNLPHAISETSELSLFFAIWIGFAAFITFTIPKMGVKLSLITSLCFFIFMQLHDGMHQSKKLLVFWHGNKGGDELTVFSESMDKKSFNFKVKETRKIRFYLYKHVGIIHLNGDVLLEKVPSNVPWVIVVSNKDSEVSKQWIQLLNPRLVIFSNNLNYRTKQNLNKICGILEVPVWNHRKCNKLEISY